MNESNLRDLLAQVSSGAVPPGQALELLRTLPFAEAGQVLADTHRMIRQGFPEAVYAEGKTLTQTSDALTALVAAHGSALATRVKPEVAANILSRLDARAHYAQMLAEHFGVECGDSAANLASLEDALTVFLLKREIEKEKGKA